MRTERSVNMDKMIDKTDAYKQKAIELHKENRALKAYIRMQEKKIEKLEKSLLSAVTNLGWER